MLKQEETPAENPYKVPTRSDQPVAKDYSHTLPLRQVQGKLQVESAATPIDIE
jgi:hypothetical protein